MMPELVWAITCKTVLTDRETNNVSYIDTIHGLAARRLPAKLPKVMLGTVWRASKPKGDTLRMLIRVESSDGQEVITWEAPKVTFEHPYHRLNIDLEGMDVPAAGDYTILVERFSRNRWVAHAHLPFAVRMTQQEPREHRKRSAAPG